MLRDPLPWFSMLAVMVMLPHLFGCLSEYLLNTCAHGGHSSLLQLPEPAHVGAAVCVLWVAAHIPAAHQYPSCDADETVKHCQGKQCKRLSWFKLPLSPLEKPTKHHIPCNGCSVQHCGLSLTCWPYIKPVLCLVFVHS